MGFEQFKSDRLLNLEQYRINILGINMPGYYICNDKTVKTYGHILNKDNAHKNLIKPFDTKNILDAIKNANSIKLHRYFNHLNSSQIMAINYFYPFIEEMKIGIGNNELSNVLKGLLHKDVLVESVEFEKESDLELKKYRKTNIDVLLSLKNGFKYVMEVKYTENGFGKAKNDANHKEKFQIVYKSKIEKMIADGIFNERYNDFELFRKNYQIIRNLLHLAEDTDVIFLVPQNNSIINRQLDVVNDVIENEKYKDKVITIYWEDLIKESKEVLANRNLAIEYFNEFEDKYFG